MGKEYYDAFAMHPSQAMTAMSIGAATPVGAVAVDQLYTNSLHATLLIVYPHSSIKLATKITKSSTVADDAPTILPINSTTWDGAHPHEVIPTRCSIRIANATQRFQQGGVIRSLRSTTGQALPTTNAEFQAICDSIKTNDRVRVKDGAEMKDQKQFNAVVVDGTRSNAFIKFGDEFALNVDDPTVNVTDHDDAGNGAGLALALKAGIRGNALELFEPAMSPLYILFEPFDTDQQYEFTIRAHYLCHYPSGKLLNNLAIHLPSNPMFLNQKRDREEAKGSTLNNVISGVESTLMGGLQLARQFPKMGKYYKAAQSAARLPMSFMNVA